MKSIVLFLSILLFSNSIFSQDSIVVLHPFIGDTIDVSEKTDYMLFPEFNDSDFLSAVIIIKSEKLSLKVFLINKAIEKELTKQEFDDYQLNIEKLAAFYDYQSNSNTLSHVDSTLADTLLNNSRLNLKISEKSIREIEQKNKLQNNYESIQQSGIYNFSNENTPGIGSSVTVRKAKPTKKIK